MSILNKYYELSVWDDVLVNGAFTEQKICVIGSHEMQSQSKALNVRLVQNINGTNTLSFSMYYQYKDNMTGDKVTNPFVQYLVNERKLKLNYDGKWYDFIIKSVKVDSSKYSYDITATDQYINELSKNGFNLTFDAEAKNNIGSVQNLAKATLAETDWIVPDVETQGSEFIPDLAKENLVQLKLSQTLTHVHQILDINSGVAPSDAEVTISVNSIIYAFYSCCKDKTPRFQFIYFGGQTPEKDDERIILNKNCQYYFDMDSNIYLQNDTYAIGIPQFCYQDGQNIEISSLYRGARYVFSPDVIYEPILKQYSKIYSSGDTVPSYYYSYVQTEYKAPILIQNWVTNPNTYKSTSGWHVARSANTTYPMEFKNIATRTVGNVEYDIIDDLQNNGLHEPYTAKLDYKASGYTSSQDDIGLLVNTGFYDNRHSIKNLANGTKFVVKLNSTLGAAARIRLGQFEYDATNNTYNLNANCFFDSSVDSQHTTIDGVDYWVVTVNNYNLTPNQFKKQTDKVVLVISNLGAAARITDFQVFEYVENGNTFFLPETQNTDAKIVTTYFLYDKNQLDNATSLDRDDFVPIYSDTVDPVTVGYKLTETVEKRRAITIKESNCFNIIQTICENFECWAEFIVDHDYNGHITAKKVIFHNYIGKNNFAGFRYGVNLKSVARTDDSKQIVTKLIVKQNSNEFGENGFCTIVRAGSNETGENNILNFDYYINQGLLNSEDWVTSIYDKTGAVGPDVGVSGDTNSNGYYPRLNSLNFTLNELNDHIGHISPLLSQAKANVTLYSNGLTSAKDNLQEASEDFIAMFGFSFTDAYRHQDMMGKINANIGYLQKCAEFRVAVTTYTSKLAAAQAEYDALETEFNQSLDYQQTLIGYKSELNKAFYSKFYRFIQEGTWYSEDYYDDEKYYLDSVSTLYTSAVPKVSYNISVIEISQLLGYEDFVFALGDKTFVEDPEFFGYDDEGSPVREEVTLTEIAYNLDSPEKNTIKVQNYKNQFQDLFKKITATVQSVSYSTGAYDKAAALADANDRIKSQYLQGALNDAGTILQNLAEQTVRIDANGLTITDGLETNKALRAVGGGILLTEDGGNTWALGLTANGVNAKVITSGTVNTSVVNIMHGNEPTFRWDSYGITAYDYTNGSPLDPNFAKGVRFDRLGLYGFDLNSSADDWRPTGVAEWVSTPTTYALRTDDASNTWLRHHSTFELTREGLYLSLGTMVQKHYVNDRMEYSTLAGPITHSGEAYLGRVDDLLYNSWTNDGLPYYNPESSAPTFVKIMAVGNGDGNQNLVIYDDGTLTVNNIKLTGNITWTDASSPSKSLYGASGSATAPEGPYNDFPESTGNWHKNKQPNDQWYYHTDNGGASWQGPFLITGRGEASRAYAYIVSTESTQPAASDPRWSPTYDLTDGYGKYLWTKTTITYTDGTTGTPYIVGSPLPSQRPDFNVTCDAAYVIQDQNGIFNVTTVPCRATAGDTTYSWQYELSNNGTTWDTPVPVSETTNVYNFPVSVLVNKNWARITCTGTHDGISATDYILLPKVQEGSDGWTVVSDNPNLTFSADYNGNFKANQQETIHFTVLRGTQTYSYGSPGSSAGYVYTITSIPSSTTSLNWSLNSTTGVLTATPVTGAPGTDDTASITINAYYNSSLLESFSLQISWSTHKDGAPGSAGAPGEPALTLDLDNDNESLGANYDGSGASFEGHSIQATVLKGLSVDTGWTFTYNVAPSTANRIVTGITNGRVIFATGTDAIWATTWPDTITITISATKTGNPTLSRVYTASRLNNGEPGTWYTIDTELTVLKHQSDHSFFPSTFTVYATKHEGSNKSDAGWIAYSKNGTYWDITISGSAFATGSSGGDIQLNLTDNDTAIYFAVITANGVVDHQLVASEVLDGPEMIPIVNDGAKGESPYSISLSNDFDLYGVGANDSGWVQLTEYLTVLVFSGVTALQPYTDYSVRTTPPTTDTPLYLLCTADNNMNAICDVPTTEIYGFRIPEGTITYSLCSRVNGTVTTYTQKTYSIVANKQGQPGETWDIDFNTPDVIVQNTDGSFPITELSATTYKKVQGVQTAQAVYWSVNITGTAQTCGSSTNNTIRLRINNNTWQYALGSSTTWTNLTTATATPVQLLAYVDSSRAQLFSRETIDVIPHGAQGAAGTSAQVQEIYFYNSSLGVPITKPSAWVTNVTPAANTWTNIAPDSSTLSSTIPYVYIATQTLSGSTLATTDPILYQAWSGNSALSGSAAGRQRYATLLTLTNGDQNQGIYYNNTGSDATLYINAECIKTGSLLVSNGDNTVFSADVTNHTVQIAGFVINNANSANGSALFVPHTTGSLLLKYSGGSGTTADPYIPASSAIYLGTRNLYYATGNKSYQVAGTRGSSTTDFRFVIGPYFGVMSNGTLYANAVHLTGEVNATSGTFGNGTTKWTIGNDSTNSYIRTGDGTGANDIYIGTDEIRLGNNFSVSKSGSMMVKSGYIGSSTKGFHVDSNSLYFGSSFSTSKFFICSEGSTGTSGTFTVNDYTGTGWIIFARGGTSGAGKFGVLNTGVLYAADVNLSGTIKATGGSIGGIDIHSNYFGTSTSGHIGDTNYYAYYKASGSNNNDIMLSVFQPPAQSGGASYERFTVYCGKVVINDAVQGSDKRFKTDIQSLNYLPETFFDNLKPCSFVMKHDNETHFGFVAQDVVAILPKELKNQGLVSCVNDRLHLAYQDFIALNTWQIQKLKQRIADLEDRITQLESNKI